MSKFHDTTDSKIAARIRQRREQLNLSVADAAKHLDCDELEFAGLESGKSRVGAARLMRLSELFEVDVGFFFEVDAQPSETMAQISRFNFSSERKGA